MKIVTAYPPNYDAIVAAFPEVKNQVFVLFTYGDTIYNPSGKEVPFYTLEHEAIHELQQMGMGPRVWWDRFLAEPDFRFEQELDAYRKEYQVFCRAHKDRNERSAFVRYLAQNLAGPLYGNKRYASDVALLIAK